MKNNLWEIPDLWPGSTVFIIGGGVSLLQQDLTPLHNQRVIGVNHAFRLGPWVDVCWYGDRAWYGMQGKDIKEYGGLIVTCSNPGIPNRHNRVMYVGRSKPAGIEYKSRSHVAWNNNSGASAINLAWWLGARTVVLLGFDMQNPPDRRDYQSHWHNFYGNRFEGKTKKLINPYNRFLRHWPTVKQDAQNPQVNLKIINATVGGALELFERRTLEDVCRDL